MVYLGQIAYLFILKLSSHWYAKRRRGCWENLKRRNLPKNQKIYFKLKNMQIETINTNNILKTWCRNCVRPAGVYYTH